MIVALRTTAQAARVADLTGGTLLHDDQGRLTGHRARRRKTNLGLAAVGEARTKARSSGQRNPAMGASGRDH